MAVFGVHVVLPHGCDVVQFAPGDEVPDWAVGLVGDHCLRKFELRNETGPELVNFDGPVTVLSADDTAALLAAESEGLPPADEDEDNDTGEVDAEDPAKPAAEVAPLDFTAPAKPKATRGRPAKKA